MEEQITITFTEFKSWLTDLVRHKNGALPDLEDWKRIKQMMDKVIPEKEFITMPTIERDVCRSPQTFPWDSPIDPPSFNQICASGNGDTNGAYGLPGEAPTVGQDAAAEWAAQFECNWIPDYGSQKKDK